MPVNPNPQGKANLALLNDLQHWRGTDAPERTARQVLVDYLTGLLVLSAEFNFRPVPGQLYHLYYREQAWRLSLIGPSEWQPPRTHCYAGQCRLRPDATWSVEPAEGLQERGEVMEALTAFRRNFQARLDAAETLSADLPHYEARLPYYRRVLASGLASSLAVSLNRLGLENASGRQLRLGLREA